MNQISQWTRRCVAMMGRLAPRLALLLVRYALACVLMPYGISKLLNFQFQVGASAYLVPLGQTNGKILTWAFLGYSPWFQFLLGLLETVPGLMLYFRRTWRLGAVLVFPVLLNVALMNFAMDLWPSTKVISSVMLAMDLVLLVCDYRLYWSCLQRFLEKPIPIESLRWRRTALIAELVLPVVFLSVFGYNFAGAIAQAPFDFIGKRQINRAGTWSIKEMRIGGHDEGTGRMYFDFGGTCLLEQAGASTRCRYKVDAKKHSFEISGLNGVVKGSYALRGGELWLDGTRDGQALHMVLVRSGWGRMFPMD